MAVRDSKWVTPSLHFLGSNNLMPWSSETEPSNFYLISLPLSFPSRHWSWKYLVVLTCWIVPWFLGVFWLVEPEGLSLTHAWVPCSLSALPLEHLSSIGHSISARRWLELKTSSSTLNYRYKLTVSQVLPGEGDFKLTASIPLQNMTESNTI